MKSSENIIAAERQLLFSAVGDSVLKPLTVRITIPRPANGLRDVKTDPGTAFCVIQLYGLPESDVEVHGIDALHALAQAVDIDRILCVLRHKYCFYWSTGEPYFE